MSTQIQFRTGYPQKYIATRSFALGKTGMTIPSGAEVEFDGNMVSYGGMPALPSPQLRGAVRARWIVLAETYDPMAPPERPVSAGIQMRAADTGNPMDPKPRQTITATTVEEEERVVADVRQHADQVQHRNTNREYRQGSENRAVRPGDQGYQIIEDQGGVPVRTLQTPAKQTADMTRAGSALAAARNVTIAAGEGQTREQMMAQMTPQAQAEYAHEIAARAGQYDSEAANRVVAQVAQPRDQVRDGINLHTQVGGGVEIHDAGGTGVAGPDQVTKVVSEGVTFTNTNGPKKGVQLVPTNQAQATPAPSNGVDDAMCRTIAKSFCPDFPANYVFTDSPRKKIARLQADFEDRHDIIRAVAASDPDGNVKRRVIEEFPEAFS